MDNEKERLLGTFDENQKILISVLKDLPIIDDYLGRLYNHFENDLLKILSDTNGWYIYHTLMIKVISHYEYKLGNYKLNGMNYSLNKEWKDIVNEYGGTLLLPLIGTDFVLTDLLKYAAA
jgi:hypothetical protein